MAIQCTHCGVALKEGARFCNVCGTLVPSHPLSPKSTGGPSSPVEQSDNTRVVIREQIAQQPPARPIRRIAQDEPPSWLGQLDHEAHTRGSADESRNNRQDALPPIAQVDTPPKHLDFRTADGSHPASSAQERGTWSAPPPVARTLRVKVWEEHQPEEEISQDDRFQVGQRDQRQQGIDDDEFEDLPTGPLIAKTPSTDKQPLPASLSSQNGQRVRFDDVDQMDTVPLATYQGAKPNNVPSAIVEPAQQQRQARQEHDSAKGRAVVQWQPSASPPQYQGDADSFAQNYQTASPVVSTPSASSLRQTPSPLVAVPPTFVSAPTATLTQSPQRRKPSALLLVILLLLIIGGGVGAWIVLYQPFTVAKVTQPQQTFANTQMGVSLQYPNGWTAQIDMKKSTAHLSDSSQTAQFELIISSANGVTITTYLQQEAAQLTMTGVKPGAGQTFAGTSWQQLQGSALLNGASYTETLFATVHQQKVYTIVQLAPQATYAQEEQQVFAGMRSSFQFVA